MQYDLWKTGYYDDAPQHQCYECRQHEQTLDEAANFLEEIVKQLYIKQIFDKEHFEFALQELGHLLKVAIPNADLNVLAKPTKIEYINHWIETNNTFLKNLAK